MTETERCLHILGLQPGASREEIKHAYRDMVKVWHPDRFQNEPRLLQIAGEKMKEINEAYRLLATLKPDSSSRSEDSRPKAQQYGAGREAHTTDPGSSGFTWDPLRDRQESGGRKNYGAAEQKTGSGKDESDRGRIMLCHCCGAKNRVHDWSVGYRPVCGNCGRPLGYGYSGNMAAMTKGKARPLAAVIKVAVVAFAAVALSSQLGQSPRWRGNELYRVLTPMQGGIARHRTLPNGEQIKSRPMQGEGILNIVSGLDTDAVVKLVRVRDNESVSFFYVSSRSQHSLRNIESGEYRLMYCTGNDWDAGKGMFARGPSFGEFDGRLTFETRQRVAGNHIVRERSVKTITLRPVGGENASTHKISAAEFAKR
jgi:hypothetical protein